MSQSNRGRRKHILSSLTTLGASEPPVTHHAVARPGVVVASVAAAGISNPNVNIGFASGDLSKATLNIGSLA